MPAQLASAVELLWTGGAWLEGPTWLAASGRLRFSDIPNNRILEFDAQSGETSVYADGAEYANGRTVDAEGRVIQCSHGRRAIERDTNGVLETLAGSWSGGRFNAPNDVIVASDGSIWFTDPPYGLHESGAEGYPGTPDYEGCFVFRWDPATGIAEPVITDMVHPNGLAFSPDESVLYVADTGFLWVDGGPAHIRAYDVDGTTLSNSRVFVVPRGTSDGFRVDVDGNVWTSSSLEVQVFAPDASEVLAFAVPERVSNLCFAGSDLYITASTSLYRVRTVTTGA